jgi:hypothetical protein
MSTLNEFIGHVASEGLMGSSRFSVDIGLPKIIRDKNLYIGDLEKIQLYCDTVQLPGMSISSTQARTFGEVREIPWERSFDNVNFGFYVDNSMDVKLFFDNWIQSIQDPFTRIFNYYNDYTTKIDINVYDRDEKQRYLVTLYECYPKSIGAVQMDYSSKDIMKLQVSMNYRYWISSTTDDTNAPDVNNYAVEPIEVSNDYFTNAPNPTTEVTSFEDSRVGLFKLNETDVIPGKTRTFT